jgi:hypothetical protein
VQVDGPSLDELKRALCALVEALPAGMQPPHHRL